MASLVAIFVIVAAVPFVDNDGSDALTGNNGLSLDKNDAILYVSGGTNTTTFSVVTDPLPATGSIVWSLVNLDDGLNVVSLTANADGTATVSAQNPGSIEIKASLGTDYYASAVIVVFQSPGTPATVFHYYIQVYGDQYDTYTPDINNEYTSQQIKNGFWIEVKQSDTNIGINDFNAFTALQWYCQGHHWDFDASSSGWINSFLGLGTYNSGDNWVYWAQYHVNSTCTAWEFNNTTLGYISTVDSSYIGLIFWESTSSSDKPTFNGMPSVA